MSSASNLPRGAISTKSPGRWAIRPPAPARWLPELLSRERSGTSRLILLVMLLIGLPTLVYAGYLTLFASDRYETEMHFAVRGATQTLIGGHEQGLGVSATAALISINTSQEAFILANYIRSAGVLQDLEKTIDVRAIFSDRSIDYWSRLDADATSRELLDYWQRRVSTDIDAVSGIVTVKIRAFSPETSLAIAKAVLAQSEQLVNRMTTQLRDDRVAFANGEVQRASDHIADAKLALLNFRNKEATIDPNSAAKSVFDSIVKLREQRLSVENDLLSFKSTLAPDSPSYVRLKEQLASINGQIAQLEGQLTTSLADTKAASSAIAAYEELKLISDMADDELTMAEDMLTSARNETQRQQVYVDAFVPPALPEEAAGPRPLSQSLIFFAKLLVVVMTLILIGLAIREHTE